MSKAAEQDNLTAIGYLADYYAIGELVPKDNLMVVDLYIKLVIKILRLNIFLEIYFGW